MKIALLVPNFAEFSGDARVVAHQAEALTEEGHEVSIYALGGDIKPKSSDLFIIGMPKNLFWQRVYRLTFPLDIFKKYKWLPKFKEYDQIISHLYPMTFFGYWAKKKYGVKNIFWFHGLEDPSLFSHFHERMYMKLQIALTKYSLKNVDQAISVSQFAQKILKDFMDVDSIVKYNEVNETLFHKNVDGSNIRAKYNLGDSPVILSVGRVVPQKKVDLLIKAFNLVKKDLPDAKLMIVGKPMFEGYFHELKEISDESVIFIDFVPNEELLFYYAMCDIYATCTYWENYNLPVLEAQMCGKPVVAFDIESFQEEIDERGILVEKGNITEFASACLTKIQDVRLGKL